MLHFGKIPKKNGEIWRKFSQLWPTLGKFANFWKKQQKINDLATKIKPFRKILHFGKSRKKLVKFGGISAKIGQNSGKICEIFQKFC